MEPNSSHSAFATSEHKLLFYLVQAVVAKILQLNVDNKNDIVQINLETWSPYALVQNRLYKEYRKAVTKPDYRIGDPGFDRRPEGFSVITTKKLWASRLP
jgi:hypothetical protein